MIVICFLGGIDQRFAKIKCTFFAHLEKKNPTSIENTRLAGFLAGAEGFEPSARGSGVLRDAFGDFW